MKVVAIWALFVWVKFGLKVLLCVKRLAFYNSGRREVGTGGRLGRTWAGTGSGCGRPAATLSRTSCGSQVTRILILLLSLMGFLLSLLLPVFLHEPFLILRLPVQPGQPQLYDHQPQARLPWQWWNVLLWKPTYMPKEVNLSVLPRNWFQCATANPHT